MTESQGNERPRDTKWRKELRDMGLEQAGRETIGWEYFGYKPWLQFRRGMSGYLGQLEEKFPSIKDDVESVFAKLRSRGERVRAWDICGMADAQEIGADETDLLTLSLPGTRKRQGGQSLDNGNMVFQRDIFTKEALDPLITRAKERGAPAVIFMLTGGALYISGQREHPFGERMLGYQLHRALAILPPGGHIYFQNPYPEQSEARFKHLKTLISKYGTLEPNDRRSSFYRIIKFDPEE